MIYAVIVLALFVIVAVFYCIKFGIIILRVQDALEETLDVIDEKYASITKVCERPLFYDSNEVRQVLDDIKGVRDALHQIAVSLMENFEVPEDPGEGEDDID